MAIGNVPSTSNNNSAPVRVNYFRSRAPPCPYAPLPPFTFFRPPSSVVPCRVPIHSWRVRIRTKSRVHHQRELRATNVFLADNPMGTRGSNSSSFNFPFEKRNANVSFVCAWGQRVLVARLSPPKGTSRGFALCWYPVSLSPGLPTGAAFSRLRTTVSFSSGGMYGM